MKPLRRPRRPQSADSSAVLAYLSALEAYTSAIEAALRDMIANIKQRQSAWEVTDDRRQIALDALATVLRDTIYRIEDTLEGAELDDGIVSVSALLRLDEHYFTVLKPIRGNVIKASVE
jgi:hypothetical protein